MKYLGKFDNQKDLVPKSELPPEAVDVSAVLLSNGWNGAYAPFTQTISVSGITANSDGMASLSPSCTAEEREEARKSVLGVTGQGNGVITIIADGEKPLINIPITVIILN